jgi:hypothetical protein
LKSISEHEFVVCSVKSSEPFEILSSHKKGSGVNSQYNQRVLAITEEAIVSSGKPWDAANRIRSDSRTKTVPSKRKFASIEMPVEENQETLEAAECLLSIGLVNRANYVYDSIANSAHQQNPLGDDVLKSKIPVDANEGIVLPRKATV